MRQKFTWFMRMVGNTLEDKVLKIISKKNPLSVMMWGCLLLAMPLAILLVQQKFGFSQKEWKLNNGLPVQLISTQSRIYRRPLKNGFMADK